MYGRTKDCDGYPKQGSELNRDKHINKISFPLLFNVASSNYTGQYLVNLKSYMIF